MAEDAEKQTILQKLLFYTTAFFILLATFSLFAFLFLVPFVIDPAFTTIFMQFEETPTICETIDVQSHRGSKNCTWSSCREGCTKDVYECTQIWVKYREVGVRPEKVRPKRSIQEELIREERALRSDYDYENNDDSGDVSLGAMSDSRTRNQSQWIYGARLFPNVKGCGYPPFLNCSIYIKTYKTMGSNFTCYFSWVDQKHVISEFDLHQVYMNLVFSMAIPIPSFIISVIYLTFAYFVIYAQEPVQLLGATVGPGATPVPPPTSGALTPASEVFREDLASFGHDMKMAMADEASRESLDKVHTSNSFHEA